MGVFDNHPGKAQGSQIHIRGKNPQDAGAPGDFVPGPVPIRESLGAQTLGDFLRGSPLQIPCVDFAHLCGFVLVHRQPPGGIVIIPDGEEHPPVVKPLLRPFQPPHKGALFDLFPFQLGEHGEDTNHRPTERRGGVEGFRHRNEVHAGRQKHFLNEMQGVPLGAGQAVEFHNQNQVEGIHLGNQLLNAGAVEVRAGITAVNVEISHSPIVRLAVRHEPLLLRPDGVALLRLFQRGDTDIQSRAFHTRTPLIPTNSAKSRGLASNRPN